MTRTREQGFTLIEMLIALGIAVTLAAIFVPTFLGQKKGVPNGSVVVAAQTFEAAAAEYLRSFPYVGGADPLLSRGGYTGPFTPDLPATTGLYGVAGDMLVRTWPTNPFTKQPVRVLRSAACTGAGAPGDVMLCRPVVSGRPDLARVRVMAWGKDKAGTTVPVYDSINCSGRCRVT